MKLKQEIRRRQNEFSDLCRTHDVKTLYAFGSSITGNFDKKTSDIDFLVEINEVDPVKRGEKLMSLWDNLEDFFQRKVDLLTDASLKNPILRENIDRTKILIYDGRGEKILV